jgi:tRNA (cmo5U34)-methyltransferase
MSASDTEPEWSEADSRLYRELAEIAVPRRAEQIAAIVTLTPFAPDAEFAIIELACGEGLLGEALLQSFPRARYLGFDGSESMRQETIGRLAGFGGRVRVEAFDLFASDWLGQVTGAGLVVSSLCVHHLDGAGKRALFGALFEQIAPGGALLLADLVEPSRAEGRALFAEAWDRSASEQAASRANGDHLRRLFEAEHWNYYRYPDLADRPSPLFEQLLWLREAGFTDVDCFWMNAGHAIYGGYKNSPK